MVVEISSRASCQFRRWQPLTCLGVLLLSGCRLRHCPLIYQQRETLCWDLNQTSSSSSAENFHCQTSSHSLDPESSNCLSLFEEEQQNINIIAAKKELVLRTSSGPQSEKATHQVTPFRKREKKETVCIQICSYSYSQPYPGRLEVKLIFFSYQAQAPIPPQGILLQALN